jgi:glucose/arabinose dehydrogenase
MMRRRLVQFLVLALIVACEEPVAGPNRAPVPLIATPTPSAMYSAGETITYSGSATDPEEGLVPVARLSWWADFHHDTHTHPFLPLTSGSASGSIMIPTTGETSDTVWYRFYLVATDAAGLADTVFRDVLPRKASITIATSPQGLQITLDGQPHAAPYTVASVVGINREIGVVTPQISGTDTYTFSSWSDAGAATHSISTPTANTTYTATFTVTTPNVPPTVAITAPANGDSAEVNTAVTVSANATDSDGTVTGVAFFDGATAIGSDATSPYAISWTPQAAGTRNLTARATDNATATTTSAPVSFKVYTPTGPDNQPPVATLTAPADSTLGLTGAVNLTATATDNVGVVGVQFQLDGVNLGAEDTSAPYAASLAATDVYTTGVHVFRVRARDAAGNFSLWSAATVTFGNNVNIPTGVARTTHGMLSGPGTSMAFAPDGRLFVCQQNGAIRVIPVGGTTLATPFHTFTVTNQGEQGLLGIAFHPNFASNGWIYVYYTSPTPTNHNRVSRITASSSNPNVSDTTETILLDDLPTLAIGLNHNGGALHFSPIDGKLYVAIGEQGTASNAQSLGNRLGKVLRYNDDISIPTDNPFYNTATGANRAIWAYGLRNPFTFNFQPVTGRMFINDVGQSTWEEINDGIAGSNYGWATTEGPTGNPAFRSPLYAYKHSNWAVTGNAIVGGAFYNPATVTFPASWVGNYFFGDLGGATGGAGWVNRLDPANGYAAYAFARPGGVVLGLEVGPDGAVYIMVSGGAGNLVYRYQAQ